MRSQRLLLGLAVTLVTAPFHAAAGQAVDERASDISLGGRLQVQYAKSSLDGAVDDVFLRRARLEMDAAFTDRLDGRLQVDFGGGSVAVKDAYARYRLSEGVRVTAGQFKRPFSVFELSSSTDLPIIERDGRIGGLSACPGVGGPCSFSRLAEKLEFDDRDLGVRLDGTVGERVTWEAAVTNGVGSPDENDGKSVSGRVELAATDVLTLAAFGALHDYLGADGGTERAPAFGVDAELGTWRDGLHVLAAVATGDNWAVSDDAGFTTVQGLVSYYVPSGGRLAGVEPLLRLGWGGSDTDVAGDDASGLLVTPGVMLYVSGKNGLAFNWDVYDPSDGDVEWSFKVQSFLYF